MTRAGKDFRQRLHRLWERRAGWLLGLLAKKRPGRPSKLTRRLVGRTLREMQDLASEALAHRMARIEFERSVLGRRSWHVKRGKGHFYDDRRWAFNDWYEEEIGSRTCIYVFWSGRRCVYVGKTARSGGRRPSSHFDKVWFRPVTRVDVYSVRGMRPLPALECLAIHRFQPTQNRFRAERRKWTQKCPLCEVHQDIEDEMRSIFRLRA